MFDPVQQIEVDSLDAVRHLLPDSMVEMAALIGDAPTAKIVQTYGGQRISIPHGRSAEGKRVLNAIAQRVGEEAALALAKTYGGTNIFIPMAARAMRILRNRVICFEYDKLLKAGNSTIVATNTLAERYRMTQRNVYNIVNGDNGGCDEAQSV